MAFDDIFALVGGLGAFQVVTFLMTGLPSFYSGYQTIAVTFLAPEQDHWCLVPQLQNYSEEQQKYVAIPYIEGDEVYSNCEYFNLPYDNLTDDDIQNWNWTGRDYPDALSCDEWVYDTDEYPDRTALSEYELVCSRSSLVQWAYSANIIALILTAPIGGILSDRFGRKRILVLASLAQCIFSLGAAFAPNYWSFYLLRFLSAVFIFFGSACGYVLAAEMFGPQYRHITGSVYWIFSACGFMILPGVAYFVRDFRYLQIALAVPMFVSLSYVVVLKESPRWLLTRGKKEEALKIILNMARVNGRKNLDESQVEEICDSVVNNQEFSSQVTEKARFVDVFCVPVVRAELLLVIPAWLASNLMYYGLSFNTGSLPGSVYINTFLAGLVEVPANLVALVSMYKLGRKPTLIWALLAASAFSFICVPLAALEDYNYGTAITVLSLFGKACITVAYTTVFMYTTEMFPTPVRHFAMSIANTVGNIMGIFAAFTGPPMLDVWSALPVLLFGVFGLIAAPLIFFLPETLNRALPDSMEEIRHLTLKDLRNAPPLHYEENHVIAEQEPEGEEDGSKPEHNNVTFADDTSSSYGSLHERKSAAKDSKEEVENVFTHI